MTNAERFMRLFRGFDRRYGQYTIEHQEDSGKFSGQARTIDQPPTLDDFEAHIKGERGIGIIPLTQQNTCFFAAIDIDVYPVDHLAIAWAVREMPLFVTRSKSNGAHIWLFIPNGARADIVVRYMKKIAGELGYGGCEVFPKQVRRSSIHDVGNWINLPYFGESRMGVVIKSHKEKELVEYTFPQWVEFVSNNIKSVTEEQLDERAPKIAGLRSGKSSTEDYVDGPPCLERLLDKGQTEGGRNEVMYQVVLYLSRKYASSDEIETRAQAWNQKVFSPMLPASELRAVIKSVTGSERGFKCHREPFKSLCDHPTCLRRAHGVGSHASDLEFEIGGFSKILSVPPAYAFNADGRRVELPNVRALSNQKEFRNYLIDAISKVIPIFTQAKYDELLRGWLKNCEDVQLAPDADPRMQWADMLTEFIEVRSHDDRDRIPRGNAWHNLKTGRIYFRMVDYKDYLRKSRVQYQDGPLLIYLQDTLGVQYHKKGSTVETKSIRLYSVPAVNLNLPGLSVPIKEDGVM